MDLLAEWPGRGESVESAAARAAAFLEGIAAIHPALSGWKAKGSSRASAADSDRLSTDVEGLAAALLRGADLTGLDELTSSGASLGVWSPTSLGDISLRLSCCSGVGAAVGDHVVLKTSGIADELGGPALEEILRLTVRVWQPSTAGIANTALLRPIGWKPGALRIGWLTYIRESVGDPGSIQHERMDEGMLLWAAPDLAEFEPEDLIAVRDMLIRQGRWG